MPTLTGPIIITTQGRTELLAGTFAPATLKLGTGTWAPTEADDALQVEVASLAISGAVDQVGDDARLHLTAKDGSGSAYAVREFGVFDAGGDCLAIYSQGTDIATKASGTTLTFALDFIVQDADVGSISVGTTDYVLPAATTAQAGIIELATTTEVQAGTDAQRAVTPAGLRACAATDTRPGVIETATDAETQAGTDATRAVTPAGLQACTATTARKGVIRTATNAEAQAGLAADLAVTPAALASVVASESGRGLIEIATSAETQAGTDTTRAVTPAGMAAVTATTARRGLVELATSDEAKARADATRALTPSAYEAAEAEERGYASYSSSSSTLGSGGGFWQLALWAGLRKNVDYAIYVTAVVAWSQVSFYGGLDVEVNGVSVGTLALIPNMPAQTVAVVVSASSGGSGFIDLKLRNNMALEEVTVDYFSAACHRVR